METYSLEICGLTRQLPLIHISKKTKLANFSFLGDVELVDRIADAFVEKLQHVSFDYLIGTEVKTVPLVHGIAKRLGQKRYIVCRKSVKPYMMSPLILQPQDHFPKHAKPLVLNGPDAALIRGKNVVVIDDVISTGVTMRMMKKLLSNVDAKLVRCFVVIKQGDNLFDAIENLDYLAQIPIFNTAS